ncbi:MAG: hypothetical protein NT013_16695 [Planctomycetia bacterium]|nr:hypothetical protein [Planctomycetia bacterium]
MTASHRYLWLALMPMLAASAEEPRSPSSSASNTKAMSDSFVEYSTDDVIRARTQEQQDAQTTLRKLRERQQINFVKLPLDQAIDEYSKLAKVRFHIDTLSLNEAGIGLDTPVSQATRKPQRLTDLLDRLLMPIGLRWHIEGSTVSVTTAEKLNDIFETRVYHVGRLLRLAVERDSQLPTQTRFNDPEIPPLLDIPGASQLLQNALQRSTSGSWDDSTKQSLRVAGDLMVVRQTPRVHREISGLLRVTELALSHPPGDAALLVTDFEEENAEQAKQKRSLETAIKVDFVNTPLTEVAKWLSERLDEEIVIHNDSLAEAGIASNSPVTFQGKGPTRIVMRHLLEPLDLTFVLHHGAIEVTTLAKQSEHLQTAVYDVADFLRNGNSVFAVDVLIQEVTSGPWPRISEGDAGSVTEFPGGLLVIQQVANVQTEIALLLHDLRKSRAEDKLLLEANSDDLVTRFYRARSKAVAESLERLLLTFVAPNTWDVNGGKGLLRIAEDRLIIRQTKTVHDQIDRFLRDYEQAAPIGTAK